MFHTEIIIWFPDPLTWHMWYCDVNIHTTVCITWYLVGVSSCGNTQTTLVENVELRRAQFLQSTVCAVHGMFWLGLYWGMSGADKGSLQLPASEAIDLNSLLVPDPQSVRKVAGLILQCKEENTLSDEKAKVVVFPPYDKELQSGLSPKDVERHCQDAANGRANLDVRLFCIIYWDVHGALLILVYTFVLAFFSSCWMRMHVCSLTCVADCDVIEVDPVYLPPVSLGLSAIVLGNRHHASA